MPQFAGTSLNAFNFNAVMQIDLRHALLAAPRVEIHKCSITTGWSGVPPDLGPTSWPLCLPPVFERLLRETLLLNAQTLHQHSPSSCHMSSEQMLVSAQQAINLLPTRILLPRFLIMVISGTSPTSMAFGSFMLEKAADLKASHTSMDNAWLDKPCF